MESGLTARSVLLLCLTVHGVMRADRLEIRFTTTGAQLCSS